MFSLPTNPKAISRELAIAAQIQRNFLPATLPKVEPFEIDAWLKTAEIVGGDFYSAYADESHLAVLIGDVAGKGIPAAMFTSVMAVLLQSEFQHHHNPGTILEHFNHLLFNPLDRSKSFITAFLAMFDRNRQHFLYASAGHTSALLFKASSCQVEHLPSTTLPLGVLPDLKTPQRPIQIQPGDVLLLYTDGFSEAQNDKGRVFGTEALIDILYASYPAHASDILKMLKQAVEQHTAGKPLQDDAAAIIIRIPPESPAKAPRIVPFVYPAEKPLCLHQVSTLVHQEIESLPCASPQICKDLAADIDLTINEVLNNIIDHAYSQYTGRIQGRLTLYPERIVIDLIDSGIPFTEKEQPSRTHDPDDIPLRGYGLTLIRNLLDVCHYERVAERNHWHLEKNIER